MTPERLAEIEARHKATGPEVWYVSAECAEIVVSEDSVYGVQIADCGKPAEDEYQPPEGHAEGVALFISHAKADIPELLKAVRDANERLERAVKDAPCSRYCTYGVGLANGAKITNHLPGCWKAGLEGK